MVRVLDLYDEWVEHCATCEQCGSFSITPIRNSVLDPCPQGRRRIQSILATLKFGL